VNLSLAFIHKGREAVRFQVNLSLAFVHQGQEAVRFQANLSLALCTKVRKSMVLSEPPPWVQTPRSRKVRFLIYLPPLGENAKVEKSEGHQV